MKGRMHSPLEEAQKSHDFADSQRKGIIIGCPLASTCGDAKYASKTRTRRRAIVMQRAYNR